jgi:hypothetical protein
MRESHIATHQWQSFEVRMRHRRVERCLVRAQVAIDAGFLDDAREAIAEARRLEPNADGIAEAERRLADAESAPPRDRFRLLPIAGAACGILAAGLTLWWTTPQSSRPAMPDPPRDTEVELTAAPPAEAEPALVVTSDHVSAIETRPPLSPLPSRRMSSPPEDGAPTRVATPTPATPIEDPPLAPPEDRETAPPRPPEPPPRTVEALPAPDAAPAAAVPAATPPPAMADDDRIRAVLRRYESAYSALDAAAAVTVYPAIDRTALARAFSGLAIQRVSLGRCDVRVTGSIATADCAGNATWTPKVGGGSHTQARRWRFDLRRTGTDWLIARATVR